MSLYTLIHRAVADALDDTCGCVVSGGIDSSTVATMARKINPRVPTFTGWYQGGRRFDERRYARMVTDRRYHTEVLVTADDFVEHFDGMAAAAEPPFMGMGTFGQYMLAKAVAESGVRTVLSGEGGDELFGGYVRLHIVAGLERAPGYEHYVLPADYPTTVAAALAYDWDRLPLLLRVDEQMCGAWGLRSVAPMTDPRLVEHVLAAPVSERVGKVWLRREMRGVVPDPILDRRDKMGMPIPLVRWANEHDGVRQLVLNRIGYLPDTERPWDRAWWVDLCSVSKRALAA